MMTVKELIRELENYDGDAEVCIAQYQRFGCDFAYDVEDVQSGLFDSSWSSTFEPRPCVQIVLGQQIGIVEADEDAETYRG